MTSVCSTSGFREMNIYQKISLWLTILSLVLCFIPLVNLFSIQSYLLIFHSISSPSHFIILTLPLTPVTLKVLHCSQALHTWRETGEGRRFSSRLLCGSWCFHFFPLLNGKKVNTSPVISSELLSLFVVKEKILTNILRESFYQNRQLYNIIVNQNGLVVESLKQP